MGGDEGVAGSFARLAVAEQRNKPGLIRVNDGRGTLTWLQQISAKEHRMTMPRRSFISVLATAFLSLPAALAFAAPQPWDDKVFQAAQAAGKPVLVDIYASW
jgi:hypothetical protein